MKKSIIALLVSLIAASSVFSLGVELNGNFGEVTGCDLGLNFSKGDKIFSQSLGLYVLGYEHKKTESEEMIYYNGGYRSSNWEDVTTKEDSSTTGLYYGLNWNVPFYSANSFGVGAYFGLQLGAGYDVQEAMNIFSSVTAAVDFNVIRMFDISVGYKGYFLLTETFGKDPEPWKSDFLLGLRYTPGKTGTSGHSKKSVKSTSGNSKQTGIYIIKNPLKVY